ncbi:PAS domain S-box-containing protein/diguanylate cyclase (GGDEF) domain-containing protein [Noviherbaspirillum humi]|uniref:PAS domain S-box-containing protein/diguanylate cyclase (GGDEF) domain-containing protein n=1 Tax=Noviherbaspirillum humi TaxID=1688639 RepID=A0A239BV67_9BURK|nr:GGDEF domain-containing phosphodiesterase [Noviherbaspirillum humi]SNS11917.1 PAS domain S-box-containing protein/diguanylate cyclase (GGDEF) domain-containing protein [Noviherbaspirillum humi]
MSSILAVLNRPLLGTVEADAAPCALAHCSADGRLTGVNRAFLDLTGYRTDELAALDMQRLMGAAGPVLFEAVCRPLIRNGSNIDEIALDLVCAGGATTPVLMNARALPGAAGLALALFPAKARRAQETRLALREQHLSERELSLKTIGRLAKVGDWRLEFASGATTWSDEAAAILGLPAGFTDTGQAYRRHLDTAAWRELNDAKEAARHSGTPFSHELRIWTVEREARWVRVVGEPVRGLDGTVTGLRGALQDITVKRETLEENRRLHERLTNTLDTITDGFLLMDDGWRFRYVNRAAEAMLRRSRADMLGKTIWEVFPTFRGSETEHRYLAARNSGHVTRFEIQLDAMDLWLEISAYPTTDGLSVYLRDITGRRQAEQEVAQLAYYDSLTALPNRRLLLEKLQALIERQQQVPAYSALLLLDLDGFKDLNDTLGHLAGDELLKAVARRLLDTARPIDTVARLGGDEFVLLLPEIADSADSAQSCAAATAEQVRQLLAHPHLLSGAARHLPASIGVAVINATVTNCSEALRRADLAMYEAKTAGGDLAKTFQPSMQAALERRARLEDDLRRALAANQFELHYQPQADFAGRIVGAEALLRWRHPTDGFIAPLDFIGIAERSGLICDIGAWVLQEACRLLAQMAREPGLADLTLSVNVSARQLAEPEFVGQVLQALVTNDTPPQRLHLELTESVLVANVEDTVAKMGALQRMGVRFQLDDFGTGYSSLAYLKRLPLDALKIDRSFVADLLHDPNDFAIARSVITLAGSLGLSTVAEGVETREQHDLLAQLGCPAYQGYYFCRPLPQAAFLDFVRAHQTPPPVPDAASHR